MKYHKLGFTLVELLIVVGIIGLLSSLAWAGLSPVRVNARDAKRIADIKQLMIALQLYYDNNGHYPLSTGCGATKPNTFWCNSIESLSGGRWIRDNGVANVLSPYMATEPIDPKTVSTANWMPLNGGTYYYFSGGYGGVGQWYAIVFGLEKYPHPFESQDGIKRCDGVYVHYGNGSNGIITLGAGCSN